MSKHVPLEHLLAIAQTDGPIFTAEEFNHVKVCSECFTDWSDFIRQSVRESAVAGE